MSNHHDDVILVDEMDRAIGTQSKLSTHQLGLRHRAISVLISNSRGEILLQRRALGKYHSGGLWTNACCSHPRPGEDVLDAAHRRLSEEMGLSTTLSPLFVTEYRAQVGDLIEHEIVHVFGGFYEGPITPDADEVCDHSWLSAQAILSEMKLHPELYTPWFQIYMDRHAAQIEALIKQAAAR
ncbi:MAG: isopentenyl-diphosphate Delta-isomerase [Alphaproteobacteria bacterium]|nr:isopentenyl-diphosphate Delta-isomerase [Alphaproteobacteria bacterium]